MAFRFASFFLSLVCKIEYYLSKKERKIILGIANMFNDMEFSFQNYDFLKDFDFEQLNSFQLKTCYYTHTRCNLYPT